MLYQSTRENTKKITGSEAIVCGLSYDGGLYVPESFPNISLDKIRELISKPYHTRATEIMEKYLTDFTSDELDKYTKAAYNTQNYDNPLIAPIYSVDNNTHFLELWHGPTSAFKDMALQVMPYLLTASLHKTNEQNEVCILVATSGDTGKAALEGFCDVKGTRIMVFYPKDGVSDIQKLQMVSQNGCNVNVVAVEGNFDDTQTGVKAIFSDNILAEKINNTGFFLSSANSINWGRLVPQIVYYFSAYCDLINNESIKPGDKINYCVPTGNFGNILAGYYAYKMGLPINKLICASNRNDVLTQFINTGVYNKKRAFYTTISPSMDILVSSNLERLLYEMSDKNGDIISSYMKALVKEGSYKVPHSMHDKITEIFASGYSSEEDTLETIKNVYNKYDYLIDPHTAVAYKALQDYRELNNDNTHTVIISTASPYKFCESVLKALGQASLSGGISAIEELYKLTGVDIPKPIKRLENSTIRFTRFIEKDEMSTAVLEFLGG
ncbi:MAG: threonine synthase [Oscillospiraceae bacterium]|jgi:threonine synthase|nr:threonine synthase [Oscillospiraceae bacterium]